MYCVGPTLGEKRLTVLRERYATATKLEEQADWHGALAHPLRLKILHLLREEGSVCVCDLRDILSVSTSVVSQHLAKLKAYRIVTSRRDGQTVFYCAAEHPIFSMMGALPSPLPGHGRMDAARSRATPN